MIANLSPKINWGRKVSMCDESNSLIIFYSNLFLQIVIVPFLCKNNPTVKSCEKFISKNTRCLHREIENRLNRPKSKDLYFMTPFKLQYRAVAACSSVVGRQMIATGSGTEGQSIEGVSICYTCLWHHYLFDSKISAVSLLWLSPAVLQAKESSVLASMSVC